MLQQRRSKMKRGFEFHVVWVNLEPWIRGLDFAALKRRAGLAERAEE